MCSYVIWIVMWIVFQSRKMHVVLQSDIVLDAYGDSFWSSQVMQWVYLTIVLDAYGDSYWSSKVM